MAATPIQDDSVLRSARREAIVVAFIWIAALGYTVGYCTLFGYNRSIDEMTFVIGFPDWIFWGIVVPWTVCLLVSWWFAYSFMADETLGEQLEGSDDDL